MLALAALGIFSSYYESDAIGPIADLLLRQRHLTQFQIGDLTAVISLPNILLAVFNGLLIDRYGPARVSLWAAVIGFAGAVLTAVGMPYALMWTGRLIFGISEGAIFIALLAGSRVAASRSPRPSFSASPVSARTLSISPRPGHARCTKPAGNRRYGSALALPASAWSQYSPFESSMGAGPRLPMHAAQASG